MQNLIPTFIALGGELYRYFTKNAGVNSVSSGFIGAFLALAINGGLTFEKVVDLFVNSQADIDRFITFLQNHGETGVIAGALVAGVRVSIMVFRAAKGK